jgi:hypothetical protein
MERHLAAARTLCFVVSDSSPKTSLTKAGSDRMRWRNMKYALSGFFGAFGSFMFPLRDFPALRCAVRNAFSRLISSGVSVRIYAACSRSRASLAAWERRLQG